MSKRFPTFGPYNLIADTNALRAATDQRKLVSQGFEAAFAELRKEAKVHLCVPEVVLGELAFQKFEMAAAAINQANSKLRLLGEITGIRQPTLPSLEQTKKRICKRYKDWCKSHEAKSCAPTIGKALWSQIVEEAIWRITPFERAGEQGHEKGFRDRIILESVVQFCSKNNDETVFLTADVVLTEALAARKISKLIIHPKLQDFTSRIRLRKKAATDEWVELLFTAAARAFYTADTQQCIYFAEGIYEKIIARGDDLLPPPNDSPYLALLEPAEWERTTDERIRLGTTRFEKADANRFSWMTEVQAAAGFAGKGFLSVTSEMIRITTFTVHWSSINTAVAEIQATKLESIELINRTMVNDTSEIRASWNLPLKVAPVTPLYSGNFDLSKLLSGTGQK